MKSVAWAARRGRSARRPSLRRSLIRLCRRHDRRTDHLGDAARRLLEADPTPENVEQWLEDLHCVADVAWEITPDGRYRGTITEQGAALVVAGFFDTLDAQGFIERMREERIALTRPWC